MIIDDHIPSEVLENVQIARTLDRDEWKLLISKMSNFHRFLLHEARRQGEEQRARILTIGNTSEWQGSLLNDLMVNDDFLGGSGKYWMTVYCLPDTTLDFAISLLLDVPALGTTRAITHTH